MADIEPKSHINGMYVSKSPRSAGAKKKLSNKSFERIATRLKHFHIQVLQGSEMKRAFKPMVSTDPVLAQAVERATENIRRAGLSGVFEQHRNAVAHDAAEKAPSVEIANSTPIPQDT